MFSSTIARRHGLLRSHLGADGILSSGRCSIPGLLQRYRKLSDTSKKKKKGFFAQLNIYSPLVALLQSSRESP